MLISIHITYSYTPKASQVRTRVDFLEHESTRGGGGGLGSQVCESMLFIHAISGCDTTSRLFSIGKGTALNKCLISKTFQGCSDAFSDESSTADQVATAGEKALVIWWET